MERMAISQPALVLDMAKSTGIVLTGVAIGMGNEFVQGYGLNFRMGIAGLGAALFIAGVEKVNEPAGVGLATIVFITMMLTPFKGKAPAQTIEALIKAPHTGPQKQSTTAQPSGQPGGAQIL
jgi:hypothetical protein